MIADSKFEVNESGDLRLGWRREVVAGNPDAAELLLPIAVSNTERAFVVEQASAPGLRGALRSVEYGEVTVGYASSPLPPDLAHIEGLGEQAVFAHVPVTLAEADRAGDEGEVELTAQVVLPDGERRSLSATTRVTWSALPKPRGWHAGDPHLHTTHSDGWLPMSAVARYARTVSGVSWLAIADHSHWIAWSEYQRACARAQDAQGILVCPGVEFKTGRPMPDGHALGYALSPDVDVPDAGQPPQDMVSAIVKQGRPESFVVIAHPYHWRYDWPDWNTNGFRGIELATGGNNRVSERTRSRWFGLLNQDLERWKDVGNPPEFVVGLASTDSHEIPATPMPGEEHMTWVGTGSSDPPRTPVDLFAQIRSGRCVASCSGDFGSLYVNGAGPGSLCRLSDGEQLELEFEWEPRGHHLLAEVHLHGPGGPLGSWKPDRTSPMRTSMSTPSEPTFYIAQFTFAAPSGAAWDVWTNPVWVAES